MTDLIPCGEESCVEVRQTKTDDFLVTFELLHEELTPFDPSSLDLKWTISGTSGVLVTISDADIEIENNYAQFVKLASFFSGFTFMASYTHRLFDENTNTTLLEGKFTLK